MLDPVLILSTNDGDDKYELGQYDFFIAYNYTSISGLEKEEIDKYISFVYFQVLNGDNDNPKYYLPSKCNDIFNLKNSSN